MNILYISKIDGRPWSGPSYSVPNQVKSQAKYDNVLWYNLVSNPLQAGKENIDNWRKEGYYLDLKDIPSGKIKDLPSPFSKPDLIIVEQGYPFAKEKIRYEIIKLGIPYIVVPRGELTTSAQNKKKLKKKIANIVLGYYNFMRKAIAIQFLTKQEQNETLHRWYTRSIIISNGTIVPSFKSKASCNDGIRCVSIGRLEPYQKGLDLLVQACSDIKTQLVSSNVKIELYGSNVEKKSDIIKELIYENDLQDIISINSGVFGSEKEAVLVNADVFLMTSRFEGHPTGLLEALSYGIPCLVTTGSNMRNEVDIANAGWCADNEISSIQTALLKMIAEVSLFSEKGHNAYKLALKYDWDHIAKKSHLIYEKIISK